MESRNKKRRVWITVGVVVAILLLLAGVVSYIKMKPFLELKKTINELKEDDYTYSLDYTISGVGFVFGNQLLDGTIEGEKADEILRGSIQIANKEYLEVYAQKDGTFLFNIKPIFEIILDKVKEENGSSVALNILSHAVKDTYVSLEQIQSITEEENVQSIEKVEVFSKLFSSYEVKMVEKPEKVERDYLTDANFFQLDFDNSDIVLTIGIPKSQNGKLYLKASNGTLELEVDAEYQLKEMEKLSMPENQVSDKTISIFKKIYDMWRKL